MSFLSRKYEYHLARLGFGQKRGGGGQSLLGTGQVPFPHRIGQLDTRQVFRRIGRT
jgi:hypothetical protein